MLVSPLAKQYMKEKINSELSKRGISHDSPLAARLEQEAEISEGGRDVYVFVRDERGDTHSIDARIDQLRNDPKFRTSFPPAPPKIAKSEVLGATREIFEKIASGKLRVE